MNFRGSTRQKGVGLVEVLVVMLVASIGLLAHVRFQKTAFREAGLSAAHIVATELAVEKIDDLRSFSVLQTTTGQRAFQDIATDAGGILPAGSVTAGNQVFNRSWVVTNWYYTTSGVAPSTSVPTGSPLPSLKQVVVTLSWTDISNEIQTYSLASLIAGIDPRVAGGIYP